MESASDEPAYTMGRTELASDLVAKSVALSALKHTRTITSVSLSPDSKFLAIGDQGGRITLRTMERNGRRMYFFDAGEGVRVGSMVWVFSPELPKWYLYIAASNGFVNCVSFTDPDDIDNTACLTAVRVPAFISHLAVNETGTILAASYEESVKVWPLPFQDGVIPGPGEAGRLLNLPFYSTRNWNHLPVRDHPRVIGIQFIGPDTLCVGYFSKIIAYTIDNPVKGLEGPVSKEIWTIHAPNSDVYSTNIASFCISPSRDLVVAANLHSGFDWYSISLQSWLSATKVDDAYGFQNYILPVRFLTDRTFVAGHNYGTVTIGTNGVDRTVSLGKKRGTPSKVLTVGRSESKFIIASACGHVVSVQVIEVEGDNTQSDLTRNDHGRSLKIPQAHPLGSTALSAPPDPSNDAGAQTRDLLMHEFDDIPMTSSTSELVSLLSTPTPQTNRNRLRDVRQTITTGDPGTPRPVGAFFTTPVRNVQGSSMDFSAPNGEYPTALPPLAGNNRPETPTHNRDMGDLANAKGAASWLNMKHRSIMAVSAIISIVAVILAIAATSSTHRGSGLAGSGLDFGAGHLDHHGSHDSDAGDIYEEEELFAEGEEGEYQTIVVTETKLMTITRTVSTTLTTTVTVTAQSTRPTKRSQKLRGRR